MPTDNVPHIQGDGSHGTNELRVALATRPRGRRPYRTNPGASALQNLPPGQPAGGVVVRMVGYAGCAPGSPGAVAHTRQLNSQQKSYMEEYATNQTLAWLIRLAVPYRNHYPEVQMVLQQSASTLGQSSFWSSIPDDPLTTLHSTALPRHAS